MWKFHQVISTRATIDISWDQEPNLFSITVFYRKNSGTCKLKETVTSTFNLFLSNQTILFSWIHLKTPKLILFPFILTTIIYWLSALNNDPGVYIQVVLIFVLNTQIAVAYGTFISIIAGNIDAALALVVPILMPLLIFSGFFLNNDSTPVFFLWIKYISWMFYCNESINIVVWKNTGTIPCSTAMANSTCAGRNCFDDGYAVLDFLSFSEVLIS